MRIINKSHLSHKALQLIKSHIKSYNIDKLKYIKLSETNNSNNAFYGYFRHSKIKPWIIVATVHKSWKYPFRDYVATGTKRTEECWAYTGKEETFNNYNEALLFCFFHEWFHFIRHTKQIAISAFGRNGEPGANKYALAQLKHYGYKKNVI